MKTFRNFLIVSTFFLCGWVGNPSYAIAQELEFTKDSATAVTVTDIETLEKQAYSGNVQSQLRLGAMYRDGTAVSRNTQRAFYWLSQAAKNGHVLAQLRVAKMFQEGVGVEQNHRSAFEWFSRSAQSGQVDALTQVGKMLRHGIGTPTNLVRAFEVFLVAAKKGKQRHKITLLTCCGRDSAHLKTKPKH